LVANHGKFPVMLNAAWMNQVCTIPPKEAFGISNDSEMAEKYNQAVARIPASSCKKGGEMIDEVHSIMGPNSHLKALADIAPLGGNIYSIGDGLLYLGYWLFSFSPYMWLALTVRKIFVS
jgi:hypothetical protein